MSRNLSKLKACVSYIRREHKGKLSVNCFHCWLGRPCWEHPSNPCSSLPKGDAFSLALWQICVNGPDDRDLVTSSRKKLPIEFQSRVQADHTDIHVTKIMQCLFRKQMGKGNCSPEKKKFWRYLQKGGSWNNAIGWDHSGREWKATFKEQKEKLTLKRYSLINRKVPE